MDLREYRRKHGLSQSEVAKAVGVNTNTICRYETGERIPRPKVARRIIKWTAGEVTAEDLICGAL